MARIAITQNFNDSGSINSVPHPASGNASCKVEGLGTISGTTGTVMTLINAQNGKTITFTSSDAKNYNEAAVKVSATSWTFGTVGANTAAKATRALHIALEAARVDGAIQMTLTPGTYTSETSFTLTQNGPGAIGNTAIVVPTTISINDDAVSTTAGAFTGGFGLPNAGNAGSLGSTINAANVTDDDFDGTTTTKGYGTANGTEARFLQKRLLGMC